MKQKSRTFFDKKYVLQYKPENGNHLVANMKLDRLIKAMKADLDQQMIKEYIDYNNIKVYSVDR